VLSYCCALKRKQALLRSNLPAIRAWAMNKIFVDRYRQKTSACSYYLYLEPFMAKKT
jgi:hypothetical protein